MYFTSYEAFAEGKKHQTLAVTCLSASLTNVSYDSALERVKASAASIILKIWHSDQYIWPNVEVHLVSFVLFDVLFF